MSKLSTYRKAAEEGDAETQFILAGCYKSGDELRENPAEAPRCLSSLFSWRK
jgi:TPR repeat protein